MILSCGIQNSGSGHVDAHLDTHIPIEDVKKVPDIPPAPEIFVIQDITIYDPLSEFRCWERTSYAGRPKSVPLVVSWPTINGAPPED